MADAPTEEQVKTANDAELAKWEDDFDEADLNVPASKEDKDAQRTDEKTEEEPKDGDAADDEEEPAAVYSDPAPVVTIADPGDYTPADYSFEVTLKDGKTVKVSTPEEAEKLADDPDNFETPKQLMDFINKQNKMNHNLDRDHDKWEADKSKFDEQTAIEAERQEKVDSLVKGFEYLVSKGFLPKVAEPDLTADWSDPEIAKHDGVKEQVALMNYMVKENKNREKAGVPLLNSALDAYNAWQLDTSRQRAEAEHKADGEARKTAGARVAGVSPAAQAPYVPKGISVGRTLNFRGGADWED